MLRYGSRLVFRDLQQKHPGMQGCNQFATVADVAKRHVQEIQVPVPWGNIAGKWWGDRNVQPVLGLHGLEDNANTFDTLAPLLKVPSFLAVDMFGHGLSSYFPAIGSHNFLDVLLALRRVVDHFKWTKISIIGHSFGSAVGFAYSALYPDDVDKFVSIDCARTLMMPLERNLLEQIRYSFDRTLAIEQRLLASDPPSYTREELLELVYVGSKKSPSRDSCEILLQRGIKESPQGEHRYYLSRDPRLRGSVVGTLTDDFILACAQRIKCRVLSIRANDGFLQSGMAKQVYLHSLDLIQQCEHHDVNGNHHLHLNNPENVAPLINGFFNNPKCNL